MGKSMNAASSMSSQPTFEASPNAISSPGSEAGVTPSALPDGPTMSPSGPAPVPVSRFRSQDSEKAMPINDTCGPLFTASSPSFALQSSLESRLRARMGGNGSPLFALTWKEVDMPAGVPICALRASGHRTSGSGCTSWPTSAAWQTPKASDGTARLHHPERADGGQPNLDYQAALASWPTPQAFDVMNHVGGNLENRKKKGGCANLRELVYLASWPTPVASDHKRGKSDGSSRRSNLTAKIALVDSGPTPTGSPAPTAKRDQLNPRLSGWLMGYPTSWDLCALRVTPTVRTRNVSSMPRLSRKVKREL